MNNAGNVNDDELYPDIVNCRAESVGLSGFAECRCAGPNACVYALPFGYAFLCQHPHLEEILENTKKDNAGATTNS